MKSGANGSLKALIFKESMRKARTIDGPSYEFPERLPHVDWVVSGIVFGVMVVLSFVGFFF